VLYTLFFIYPFLNGLYISMTNWDGLTPRSPISMDVTEFNEKILAKVKRADDRDYLLSIYSADAAGSMYGRQSLSGGDRRRVESILRKAGFAPEKNRFVGLKNYADILSGKVSDQFYPRSYTKSFFNIDSGLPASIPAKDLDRNFFPKLDDSDHAVFDAHYAASGDVYALREEYDEFAFEDRIWMIDEVEKTGSIPTDRVESLISAVAAAALARDVSAKDAAIAEFLQAGAGSAGAGSAGAGSAGAVSEASAREVRAGAEGIFELGDMKTLLSSKWSEASFDLGVIGFTVFFAIFSVIGINLLAFLLALALDSGIRGQKILRSVFFLPNVLSMVIVALIWKMLFFQLFPVITGIDQWLSDTAKTPWLIVLVAVWQGAGYYMIVYLAGLQNIPIDVVEAATIDGANAWQRFKSITLPLLVPAITISLFLTIANALKCFDLIYAMTSGSGYTYGTVPLVLDIFFDAFARKQAGLATAKAMLLFLAIFAITGLQLVVMKRKEIEQ
jgi:raffinose/stachyose/melibiose transport system permease protein